MDLEKWMELPYLGWIGTFGLPKDSNATQMRGSAPCYYSDVLVGIYKSSGLYNSFALKIHYSRPACRKE